MADKLFTELERKNGLPAGLLDAVWSTESSRGKNMLSPKGARGHFGFMPSTASEYGLKDPDDLTQAASAAARKLADLNRAYGGDLPKMLAAYNWGDGRLARNGLEKAPAETRNYISKVSETMGKQGASAGSDFSSELFGDEKPSTRNGPLTAPAHGGADLSAELFGSTPAKAGNDRGVLKSSAAGARNLALGALRGAGSIGATLLAPIDMARDAIDGKGLSLESNRDRRKGMDAGLQELGADPNSLLYKGGKLVGEIAGTAGAGGVVAAPLRLAARALPQAAPSLGRLATSASSAGMTVGPGGGALGNMALRAAGGASAAGVGAGLVDPESAGSGAVVGAVAPPVLRVAGAIGGATVGAVRGLRDVATQSGQERIARSVLQTSATNPEAAAVALAKAQPHVPGSLPTIGQAAVDPGLAQLERTLLNNPQTAGGLQARFAEQRAARSAAIDDVAATAPGSGSYYDDIQEGRRVFANEDYAKARAAGVDPEAAASMQAEMKSLLERPSIQTAIKDARRLAAETGETVDDLGSVQGLDWVKKALDNQISKAGNGTTSSIGAEDLRALVQTRNDLNATLEQLAPAYREANRNFAAMSRQVNSMDVARGLERSYTPSAGNFGASAREQGAAYMKALRGAQDTVKAQTGRDLNLSGSMSTADIFALENVAKDLARKEYAETAGRAVGSPTAQNMLSQYLLRSAIEGAGLPASGAVGSTALNTLLRPLQFAGRLAEPKVNNRLLEYALDPARAAAALRAQPVQDNALAKFGGSSLPMRVMPALIAD